MEEFKEFIEEVRAEHTLDWLARALVESMTKNEMKLLIESLDILMYD